MRNGAKRAGARRKLTAMIGLAYAESKSGMELSDNTIASAAIIHLPRDKAFVFAKPECRRIAAALAMQRGKMYSLRPKDAISMEAMT